MKKILLFSTLLITSLCLTAQTQSGSISDVQNNQRKTTQNENTKGFQKENLRFGGNFGMVFGDVTYIDISPMVGYQFTPRFQAGMGVIYNYYSEKFRGERFSMHIFGANPYAQYDVVQASSLHIFLRTELGLLNYDVDFVYFGREPRREFVFYPMVGGGVLLPIGRSGGISARAMWDLSEKQFSIYGRNPIIQVGFMFGL